MKITAVETMLLRIPYRQSGPPTGFGGKVWTTLDTLLVRVDTDAGVTGWGEAFGYNVNEGTKATIDTLIAPLCIGRSAAAIGALMTDLQRKLHLFGRGGPVTYGLSGIDIALWDIAGKCAGLPLHRLLGGAGRQALRAYASLLRYHDPAVTAKLTAEAVDRGYRHVKLHEIELAPVASARAAVGPDIAIMVDTNCPWSLAEARDMARQLAPQDLFWLEEPIWPPEDFGALAQLRRAGLMPIAAGENAGSTLHFAHMFAAGAVDYAQPSVTKIGGISEMRKVVALAEAANVGVVPHSPYFGPGLLATLHVAASAGQDMLIERLYVDFETPLFGDLAHARNGMMTVPEGPGLGAEPDPAVIERCRAR
ncbi:MAG TPA: mandelate racemase/muconate lactonizing enzyme family protein [Stellaceae bacterium]|nr:mandelate racemase/muconate lactonizing enzyme family protein [Stellaceae bacterium]